jgi:predicted DCC family thiol-disulfide oxidoreductase YuxK
MRFATLQGEIGQQAIRSIPELATVDSFVLLHRGGAWVRSTAALELARYLGGVWTLALAGYLLPRPLRDAIYDAVARRRYRWFGKLDACPLPTAETRARFLDTSGG